MADDLPDSYDVIVIGTGLTESIIAAACARVGKQVLHLDHQDYYGGQWATFTLDSLIKHLDVEEQVVEEIDRSLFGGEVLPLNPNSKTITNITQEWFAKETNEIQEDGAAAREWTKSEMLRNSRKFNLDLAPKVLYSRGDMVELLIHSGICRYAEFKLVSKILTWLEETEKLVSVPCSRSDVFASTEVTIVEKRMLMKVLTACNEYEKLPEEFAEFQEKTFGEFLDSRQIKGKIRQFVLDAVAMATEEMPFAQAVGNVQKFIRSLGRYGNSPFLWTLYGSGELPQCFCRLCAVFGGIYCLKRPAQGIIYDRETGKVTGVVSANKLLKAPFVIVGSNSLAEVKETTEGTSRAIFITDRSISADDGEKISLVCFPKVTADGADYQGIKMLELPYSAMACPKDLYVVHLTCRQRSTAADDLRNFAGKFFSFQEEDHSTRPRVLWSLYFNITEVRAADSLPQGVFACSGPDWRVDLDRYVTEARTVFSQIFPDEQFLPRVPDPEDVIIEGIDDNPGGSASESITEPELESL